MDAMHMARALELAARGLNTTDPNPRVGCVIARGTEVVGEGWHERAGEAHAEAHALAHAADRARGATAYVTLEPCNHHGRTPPCSEALIRAGITRVVYASGDPNPRVNGGGAVRLKQAGIAVETGLMAAAARELNIGFMTRMEARRPWVRLKLAASLDGRTALAGGESKWITGDAARLDVQRLRARASAIMTGIGTVLRDDPRLDVRLSDAERQPLRVVLDPGLRTPPSARILGLPGRVLILTSPERGGNGEALEHVGVMVEGVARDGQGLSLPAALDRLAALDVNELHVESGPKLAGALLEAGLVDELVLYMAPVMLGPDAQPLAQLPRLDNMRGRLDLGIHEVRRVGEDLRITLRRKAARG
jgi:diaminohydroxyphosphoribosylaminopyrimidine deaminase/5-amino-6-(5-phosphoribosylamino)uracil reductase